jgi:hypothetical protein
MKPRYGQRFVVGLILVLALVALALTIVKAVQGSRATPAAHAGASGTGARPAAAPATRGGARGIAAGAAAYYWVREYRRRWIVERTDGRVRARTIRRLRRTLRADHSVGEAISLACTTYAVSCTTLWRKALCETGRTLSSRAYNSSSGASGLFQFLPSTWRSTPYARLSVWSPYANALAAGWMHDRGRGGEWACR